MKYWIFFATLAIAQQALAQTPDMCSTLRSKYKAYDKIDAENNEMLNSKNRLAKDFYDSYKISSYKAAIADLKVSAASAVRNELDMISTIDHLVKNNCIELEKANNLKATINAAMYYIKSILD